MLSVWSLISVKSNEGGEGFVGTVGREHHTYESSEM